MNPLPVDIKSLSPVLITLTLVALAEVGDKSQLMCMALARRGSALAVFAGAGLAFELPSLLAVWLGAGLSRWIPCPVAELLVVGLFTWFGVRLLRSADQSETVGSTTVAK